MPDITLCTQKECPKSQECARYIIQGDGIWQSYFSPDFDENGCNRFVQATQKEKDDYKIRKITNE